MPSSTSFQNAVILCARSNIQRDSSEDIVDGILEIALILRRTYNYLNITVCGLLPYDENRSINRIYIRQINDYLSYKCDLNGVRFIKPNDWILRNGFSKDSLYDFDNLHLIKDGNIKLSKSIVNIIKPIAKPLKMYRSSQNYLITLQILYKNKITRSSIIEYLLLKVKINYTQYFGKNQIGIIRLKTSLFTA